MANAVGLRGLESRSQPGLAGGVTEAARAGQAARAGGLMVASRPVGHWLTFCSRAEDQGVLEGLLNWGNAGDTERAARSGPTSQGG